MLQRDLDMVRSQNDANFWAVNSYLDSTARSLNARFGQSPSQSFADSKKQTQIRIVFFSLDFGPSYELLCSILAAIRA